LHYDDEYTEKDGKINYIWFNDYKWQKFDIPLSYFDTHGTIVNIGESDGTFNIDNATGLAFYVEMDNYNPDNNADAPAYDRSGMMWAGADFARLADVKFAANSISAPENFAAEGAGTVTLSWDSVDGASNYKIFRDNVLIENACAVNSYTDTGVSGEPHEYTVQAYNADSVSAPVNTVLPSRAVSAVLYKDENGNAVTSIGENTQIKAAVTVDSTIPSASLYLAVYKGGRLIDIKSDSKTDAEDTVLETGCISLAGFTGTGYIIRSFVWTDAQEPLLVNTYPIN
jgi:hypothetical protein